MAITVMSTIETRRRGYRWALSGALLLAAACGGAAPAPSPTPPAMPAPEAAPAPGAEAAAPGALPEGALLVADFNAAGNMNALGGEFGAWASAKPDPDAKSVDAVDPTAGAGGTGGWKIDYDISKDGSYCGTWLRLKDLDGTKYKTFRLSVKATASGPVDFIVELKTNGGQNVGRYVVRGVGADWKVVEVPLTAFNLPSLKPMYEFTTVFDKQTTSVKTGSIVIDDIAFLP